VKGLHVSLACHVFGIDNASLAATDCWSVKAFGPALVFPLPLPLGDNVQSAYDNDMILFFLVLVFIAFTSQISTAANPLGTGCRLI
jgi:SNF family Na+-dependent transporter